MSTCDILELSDDHAPPPLSENEWRTVAADRDAVATEDDERIALMFALMDDWDKASD